MPLVQGFAGGGMPLRCHEEPCGACNVRSAGGAENAPHEERRCGGETTARAESRRFGAWGYTYTPSGRDVAFDREALALIVHR